MSELRALFERWKQDLMLPGKPNEWEVKQLLSSIDIDVPKGVLLTSKRCGNYDAEWGDEERDIEFPKNNGGSTGVRGREFDRMFAHILERIQEKITFPCVVKVCSGEMIHKTEKGGVAVGVTEEGLRETLMEFEGTFPGAAFLIEEMVPYDGFEFIVGGLEDATFGPAVMVGAGGILTELYQDVSFRLAPCSKEEALSMLGELRIYPVLRGYRNIKLDCAGLAETIEKLGRFAEIFTPGGNQLDINPIVWSEERWIALDGKVVLSDNETRGEQT